MKQKKHHIPIAKEKSKNQYSPVPLTGICKGDVCTRIIDGVLNDHQTSVTAKKNQKTSIAQYPQRAFAKAMFVPE